VKPEPKLAESSKDGYGTKSSVSPTVGVVVGVVVVM
jgi:hypothetical protein